MGVMNVGMSMVGDLQRLQDISQELSVAIEWPSVLPEKSIDYLAEILYHLACHNPRLVAVLLHSLFVVHHQLQDYHNDHKALIN
ncbi:uncharacterized protein [Dysidea avara]|uniref:uncharacterized protein isoform X2 n=1 Tax=Dysidea avara TaxID=196820 RepID=UPI003319B4A1